MLVFVFDMCGNLLFSIQQISSNSTQFDRSIDVVVISSFPTTQSTELYNSVSPRPKRKALCPMGGEEGRLGGTWDFPEVWR